jgi:hypothetical protein
MSKISKLVAASSTLALAASILGAGFAPSAFAEVNLPCAVDDSDVATQIDITNPGSNDIAAGEKLDWQVNGGVKPMTGTEALAGTLKSGGSVRVWVASAPPARGTICFASYKDPKDEGPKDEPEGGD